MSISSLQSSVQRAQSDVASLMNKLSGLTQKLGDKTGRLASAQDGLARAKTSSAVQSKLREISQLQKDMAGIEKDRAGVEKQIGDKKKDLHRYEQDLAKEQQRETKKQQDADKRRMNEMTEFQRSLDRDLSGRRVISPIRRTLISRSTSEGQLEPAAVTQHDLFISHAGEDKEDFVRPLAEALRTLGLDVWYDETSLTLGDSLRQSIDKGLANSKYGVVVLSTAFFAKNWPQYELNGMVAREMNGVKVILPIWHKVSKDEVLGYSPTLADKVALNSSLFSIGEIAQKLAEVVKG